MERLRAEVRDGLFLLPMRFDPVAMRVQTPAAVAMSHVQAFEVLEDGFPHHLLKMPLYARGLRFVRYLPST